MSWQCMLLVELQLSPPPALKAINSLVFLSTYLKVGGPIMSVPRERRMDVAALCLSSPIL